MIVTFGGGVSHHLAALGFEAVVKFSGSIAVVVAVRFLVAHTKDGDLGVRQIKAGKGFVQPVVPRRSRALRVFTGVPSRRSDDNGIVGLNISVAGIANVISSEPSGFGNVTSGDFRIACRSRVVKANFFCIQSSGEMPLGACTKPRDTAEGIDGMSKLYKSSDSNGKLQVEGSRGLSIVNTVRK